MRTSPRKSRPFPAAAGALLLAAATAAADDKDLLKRPAVKPNVLIVFGNSQTTTDPLTGFTSSWDGDADSPNSKMGAAKRVIRDFVREKAGTLNIGLGRFASNPNVGAISMTGKHWLYTPAPRSDGLPGDFCNVQAGQTRCDVFAEAPGTIERWGPTGAGPCTDQTTPSCKGVPTAATPHVRLNSQNKSATLTSSGNVPYFFGKKAGGVYPDAFLYLGTATSGKEDRIRYRLVAGDYGDAYTDGSLSSFVLGDHAVEVDKTYETWDNSKGAYVVTATPTSKIPIGQQPIRVKYVPYGFVGANSLASDLYYTTGPEAGKQIGFLSNGYLQNNGSYNLADYSVGANCSGWWFQSATAPLPLVRIPRDYVYGPGCNKGPEDSTPCIKRLLRPQAMLVDYDPATGSFKTTFDYDNNGYNDPPSGQKYADGCNADLLGAADQRVGMDVAENQAILTTRNGSQAPIKGLLSDIYTYVTDPSVDGFSIVNNQGMIRQDDPYSGGGCRSVGIILVYDNFNGCQNDNCSFLRNMNGGLDQFRAMNVPIFVIGLGSSAAASSGTGVCIAKWSGAYLPNTDVPAYWGVTDAVGLKQALNEAASILGEATRDFASASISAVQAGGDQMAYIATFNATKSRSIWDGRLNGYKLNADGTLPMGTKSVTDSILGWDGQPIQVPSNDPAVLRWNAGKNLQRTPGTGATTATAILAPGATPTEGSYEDRSNDPGSTGTYPLIKTRSYPGRKVVFSLPDATTPTLVPEPRYDLTATSGAAWWPRLLTSMGNLTTAQATESLRFIWGDRDAITGATVAAEMYGDATSVASTVGQLKLGDIFHSNPSLIGAPSNYFYWVSNLNGYQAFATKLAKRRRVLYTGANDGLLHAFDVGVWNRNADAPAGTTWCQGLTDTTTVPGCYDLGTGLELFAYAPRATMPIFYKLRSASSQDKTNEWTVDGAPAAADVYIKPKSDSGTTATPREWRTVLVGMQREGSPYEGVSGQMANSYGSVYALDVTQPDAVTAGVAAEGTADANGELFGAPACLNANSGNGCANAWPSVLWELSDRGDLDQAGSPGATFPDMGETWSKPGIGRIKISCSGNCGTSTSSYEEKYVAIFGGGFDRERQNRRGNWLYMVDIETGSVLYRANSSCGSTAVSGCTPVAFGSIPSEPAVIDLNGDGYLDLVYVGDLKGQVWKVDLSNLRYLNGVSPTLPGDRWANKIDFATGTARPFLLFKAGPTTVVAGQSFPIYYRPVIFAAGVTTATLGVAFGTGDRDDVLASVDPASLTYSQRYYVVLDGGQTTTLTEGDLTNVTYPLPTTPPTISSNGWYVKMAATGGERLSTDGIAVQGYLYFSTFSPMIASTGNGACGNSTSCTSAHGTSRLYTLNTMNGNPPPGQETQSTVVPNTDFVTSPIFYTSADKQGHIGFATSMGGWSTPSVQQRTMSGVKEWKER